MALKERNRVSFAPTRIKSLVRFLATKSWRQNYASFYRRDTIFTSLGQLSSPHRVSFIVLSDFEIGFGRIAIFTGPLFVQRDCSIAKLKNPRARQIPPIIREIPPPTNPPSVNAHRVQTSRRFSSIQREFEFGENFALLDAYFSRLLSIRLGRRRRTEVNGPFNRIVDELFSKNFCLVPISSTRRANGYCRAARHRSNGTNSATRSFRQEEIKVPFERASAPCPISPHLAAILARSNVPPLSLFIGLSKKREKEKRGRKRRKKGPFDNCSFVRNSLKIEQPSSTLYDVEEIVIRSNDTTGGKKKGKKRVEKLEAVGGEKKRKKKEGTMGM